MELHLETGSAVQFIFLALCLIAAAAYLHAAFYSSRTYRKWPLFRMVLWLFAILMVVFSMLKVGAFEHSATLTGHMWNHLLLGMAAPLLAVLAAPMTLLLRTLSVPTARKVSRFLKSPVPAFVSHPIAAALLNTGGMFVLYRSDLYNLMLASPLLAAFIHFHLFMAGYLFTAAILSVDPSPHRFGYPSRAILLFLSLAAHGILSKMVYAFPPAGVDPADAASAGKLMYYGGDLVDALLIVLLCWKWYNSARPRQMLQESGLQ